MDSKNKIVRFRSDNVFALTVRRVYTALSNDGAPAERSWGKINADFERAFADDQEVNAEDFLPADAKRYLQTPAVNKMLKMIQLGINSGEIKSLAPMLIYTYFFGIINTTLRMILNGTLDKKSELYQSQAWLAAWNTIAKK